VIFVDVDDVIVVSRCLGYKPVQRCSLVFSIGVRSGARTFFMSVAAFRILRPVKAYSNLY
jgi:hypothetical protein